MYKNTAGERHLITLINTWLIADIRVDHFTCTVSIANTQHHVQKVQKAREREYNETDNEQQCVFYLFSLVHHV